MTAPAFPDMANIKKRLLIEDDIVAAVSSLTAGSDDPRILISISRSLLANSSVVDDLKEQLHGQIIGAISILTEHTPYDKVFELVNEITSSKATHLLSIGGGSVIDGGKIALLAANLQIKGAEALEELASTLGNTKDVGD